MTVSLNRRQGHIFAQPSQVLAKQTPASGVYTAISAKPSTVMISDRGTTLPARRLLTQTWLGFNFAARREHYLFTPWGLSLLCVPDRLQVYVSASPGQWRVDNWIRPSNCLCLISLTVPTWQRAMKLNGDNMISKGNVFQLH